MDKKDKILTVIEAAKYTGKSRQAINQAQLKGLLPTVEITKKVKGVPESSLKEYMK